ncbi:hypothetical protein KIN20_022039 [Parelaphostrongylus tenuis]|uniref:F-box domain-containing protein n=1 Tax=Parelaphostrongylus tenuis TaxID=148309 RepID=A0AAD5QV41_PARTN|nr:hypothetical protein KIN20_022039 [Parelaphostrongylus tenuis]
MTVNVIGVAQGDNTKPEFIDWQQKYGSSTTTTPRVSLLAFSVVFEMKKATIKCRRLLVHVTKRKFYEVGGRRRKSQRRSGVTKKDRSLVLELFTHLSSVFPSGEIDNLSYDDWSCRSKSFFHNTKKLLNLDDSSLVRIVQLIDRKTVMAFSQVCSRLRRLIRDNISSLERVMSSTYEIFIDFNKHTKQDDVRALKCCRSIQDTAYYGESLSEVIPPILLCQLRITFGNNVTVPRWVLEIYRLYKECRLVPIALIFGGGSSCFEGADLRYFFEHDFIAFVRLFSPHLKEVQLATSRLFAMSAFPHLLFSMINRLLIFGITYEQPSVRYTSEDIGRVVQLWRFSPKAHSCDVFINRSYGYDEVNWLLYEAETIIDGNRLTDITVEHAFLDGVTLHFHLH